MNPLVPRPPLKFRWIGRFDEIQRHLRLVRIIRTRGVVGDGKGYSSKLAFGLWPKLFGYVRDARTDFLVTALGVRIHYSRSYGGHYS